MSHGKQKETLAARRADLIRRLQAVERELDTEAPRDFEDRSSERQGDEVLEKLGHAEEIELRRIDAALSRIEDGSYGQCLECGSAISQARLAALPETALCRNCAADR